MGARRRIFTGAITGQETKQRKRKPAGGIGRDAEEYSGRTNGRKNSTIKGAKSRNEARRECSGRDFKILSEKAKRAAVTSIRNSPGNL